MIHPQTCVLLLLAVLMLFLCIGGCAAAGPQGPEVRAATDYFVYVGTFTNKSSKGIYRMRFDAATGTVSAPELAIEADSPSFLSLHPSGRFLYAVSEVDSHDGKPGGAVNAYSLDRSTGKLTFLNKQPSGGSGPTHLCVDPQGKNVLVANYNSGSVAVLPIGSDGKLAPVSSSDQHKGHGTDPQRQEGPHAHCINVDSAGRFALNCDLGLDKVFVYRLDSAKGMIWPNDPPAADLPAGAGPRHLAFSADGKFVYVINEMACTVTAFAYDAERGTLRQIQNVPATASGFNGEKSGAEIAVHPNGKFLYVSDRGAVNDLTSFRIDPQTGRLTAVQHSPTKGKAPRSFGIEPAGRWLVVGNQDTDNVLIFRIDPQTGGLTQTAELSAPTPVCFIFVARQ